MVVAMALVKQWRMPAKF
jgi:hypothetical protein